MNCARLLLSFWLLLCLGAVAADDNCPVCGNRFGEKIYRVTRVGTKDKVLICEKCVKLETVCYICRIPVARNFTTCKDGRLICAEDAARAVMDQDTAERVFDEAKVWCHGLFSRYGALPNHNIRVALEAKAQMDRTGNMISDHPDSLLMGLTHTEKNKDGDQAHTISLLHGLAKERFACVAVHEYGHTWLHENIPAGRRIHAATVEGFCEWIAHKYAEEHRFEQEIEVMEKNLYTRGQLHGFLAAEKEHGFYRVVQWMKFGATTSINSDDLAALLDLNSATSEPAPATAPAVAAAPPVKRPDKLMLKGISGTAARRFALINDQTFASGEQSKVKLGDSNIVVRCVEIRPNSVVVQVAGSDAKQELVLGAQ
jgi:hypothetical protein